MTAPLLKAVDMYLKLVNVRDILRRLKGADYEAAILPILADLERVATIESKSVLTVATEVATRLKADGHTGAAMVVLAAACESIERAP